MTTTSSAASGYFFLEISRHDEFRFRELPDADRKRVLHAADELYNWVFHKIVTLEEAYQIYLWIRFDLSITSGRLQSIANYMKRDLASISSEYLGGIASLILTFEESVIARRGTAFDNDSLLTVRSKPIDATLEIVEGFFHALRAHCRAEFKATDMKGVKRHATSDLGDAATRWALRITLGVVAWGWNFSADAIRKRERSSPRSTLRHMLSFAIHCKQFSRERREALLTRLELTESSLVPKEIVTKRVEELLAQARTLTTGHAPRGLPTKPLPYVALARMLHHEWQDPSALWRAIEEQIISDSVLLESYESLKTRLANTKTEEGVRQEVARALRLSFALVSVDSIVGAEETILTRGELTGMISTIRHRLWHAWTASGA